MLTEAAARRDVLTDGGSRVRRTHHMSGRRAWPTRGAAAGGSSSTARPGQGTVISTDPAAGSKIPRRPPGGGDSKGPNGSRAERDRSGHGSAARASPGEPRVGGHRKYHEQGTRRGSPVGRPRALLKRDSAATSRCPGPKPIRPRLPWRAGGRPPGQPDGRGSPSRCPKPTRRVPGAMYQAHPQGTDSGRHDHLKRRSDRWVTSHSPRQTVAGPTSVEDAGFTVVVGVAINYIGAGFVVTIGQGGQAAIGLGGSRCTRSDHSA